MTNDSRFCGRHETMGHGESATCGEIYYGPPAWQCGQCARKEATRLRNALEEIANADMSPRGFHLLARAALDA